MNLRNRYRQSGYISVAFLLLLQVIGRAATAPAIPVIAERVFLRVLPASGDGYFVVWNATGTTSGSHVYAQSFTSNDQPRWPEPGLLMSSSAQRPGGWEACADGSGGLFVITLEKLGLHVRRVGPDGQTRWEKEVVSSFESNSIASVVGESDGVGGVYLAWAKGDDLASVVWVQHWTASGDPQWANPGVRVASTDPIQTQPNLIADGQGGVLLAWKSQLNDLSKIRAQRFSKEGARLWAEGGVNVISPAGDLHQRILMAAPGTGGLVVAWSQGVSGVNRLFFQHVGADGTRTWSVAGVSPAGAVVEQWNPVLEGNGEGSLWVGWEEVVPGREPKVMLSRRGPPKGKAWDPGDILLSNVQAGQGRLTLVPDGKRGVLAAWIDNRNGAGLYLQHVNESGHLAFGGGKQVAAGLHHPQQPHLALAGEGRVAVVWLEERAPQNWALHHRVISY